MFFLDPRKTATVLFKYTLAVACVQPSQNSKYLANNDENPSLPSENLHGQVTGKMSATLLKQGSDASLFNKEVFLYSLSEHVSHRSLKEHFLRNFSEDADRESSFLIKLQAALLHPVTFL